MSCFIFCRFAKSFFVAVACCSLKRESLSFRLQRNCAAASTCVVPAGSFFYPLPFLVPFTFRSPRFCFHFHVSCESQSHKNAHLSDCRFFFSKCEFMNQSNLSQLNSLELEGLCGPKFCNRNKRPIMKEHYHNSSLRACGWSFFFVSAFPSRGGLFCHELYGQRPTYI